MEHNLIVLAALLHDVGKFAQRAKAPYSKELIAEFCPTSSNGPSHFHVLYTHYFIEQVLPLPPEFEKMRAELAHLASAHHKADVSVRDEVILEKADRLSSGGDRIEGEASGDYKSARLESIFARVSFASKRGSLTTSPLRYPLKPIDAEDEAIFPRALPEIKDDYAELYGQFLEALPKLPTSLGFRAYLTSLISLLERFTWCIPSSTSGTRADISLYDHLVTTAAIAEALWRCPPANERLLLVGGEISGIQKYIFGLEDEASTSATKMLRARSFFIQALTRSVWLVVVEQLGLAPTAKIMDAGGRFVLLLPDTEESRKVWAKQVEEVEAWLYERFYGSLRMTFASLPLTSSQMKRQDFCRVFDDFNDAMERAKLSPFATVFQNKYSAVLPVDRKLYAENGECAFCLTRPAEDYFEEKPICRHCLALIEEIGQKLPKAKYLVLSRTKGGLELFGGLFLRLLEGDDLASFARATEILNIRDYSAFTSAPIAGYIPVVTALDLKRWTDTSQLKEQNGKKVVADEEVKKDVPKTFAILAEEAKIFEDKSVRSINCLASCKADVDNLGLLFGIGFGSGQESEFSISRLAMLSRMLNHFFASYLPKLLQREFPNIYVIFAGGDDLFVLGPWSEVINFSERLHHDFVKFTGDNKEVTFSAGLAVFKPKLPVRFVRSISEQALESSKEFQKKNFRKKNAVTLFGVTASWEEFTGLLQEAKWLEQMCLEQKITQGMLRRILSYARDCQAFTGEKDQEAFELSKGLYLSHFAYDLKRNAAELAKDSPEDYKQLNDLVHDKDHFCLSEMSISWALYRTRIAS